MRITHDQSPRRNHRQDVVRIPSEDVSLYLPQDLTEDERELTVRDIWHVLRKRSSHHRPSASCGIRASRR